MNKYRNLFLLAIFAILIIPTNVFAKEILTNFNMELDEPVAGAIPDDKVKLTYSNGDNSFSREFDIVWCETADYITCDEINNTAFKDSYGYEFQLKDEQEYDDWIIELEQLGYEVASSDDIKDYFNGVEYKGVGSREFFSFAIGGIKEFEITIEEPIAGRTPTNKAYLRLEPSEALINNEVEVEWVEVTDQGYEEMTSEKFELGKKYAVMIKDDIKAIFASKYIKDDMMFADFRMKFLVNGKEVSRYTGVMFGPLAPAVRVTTNLTNLTSSNIDTTTALNEEYTTTLTALEKYTLPTSILVTIDGVEMASDKYTYDVKTGKLTIPASLVIGDIEIEASATLIEDKKEQTNNPNTFDGITSSILIGIISLISLIGILIYNKRKDVIGA